MEGADYISLKTYLERKKKMKRSNDKLIKVLMRKI